MKHILIKLQDELCELKYSIEKVQEDNNIKYVKFLIEVYMNKLIMIYSDSITVSNILYLGRLESDINKIKRYIERDYITMNKEQIIKDLDKVENNILVFERIGNYNKHYQFIIDNYKKQCSMFRHNIKRLSDNVVLSEDLQISINNFIVNMNILSERIYKYNKQNK